MATAKITITLPEEQLEQVRLLVAAGQSTGVSAFVKRAVEIALQDAAGWKEMLGAALEETGGPLTRTERSWVDSVLPPRSTEPPAYPVNAGKRR